MGLGFKISRITDSLGLSVIPATEILKYAESASADLIVLGVHYRNDRPCYNRLVGKWAQRVFQSAPCAGGWLVPSGLKRGKDGFRRPGTPSAKNMGGKCVMRKTAVAIGAIGILLVFSSLLFGRFTREAR